MAIDYNEIAAGALESLVESGQAVTLHSKASSGPFVPGNPVTPSVIDIPGIGALFSYAQKYIDGTNIQHGDQRMLLAPQVGAEPKAGDTVSVAAKTFNVVRVEVVAPAGIPVLYKLQLRGV